MDRRTAEMIPEAVFILEMSIANGAVVMVVRLCVVLLQPVVVLKYFVAVLAVAVIFLEVVFQFSRVFEEFIAFMAIVVFGALEPVLL